MNPDKPNINTSSIVTVVVFFILLFVFTKWGPSINFSSITQNAGQPMVVTGEGKATAVPDIVRVDFGVQDSGATLLDVQSSVNKKSQSLVASLKKLGIDDKDIKTTSYNINPQENFQVNPPVITGYQITVSYEVTVRKIDIVNSVLTTVTGAGANLVGGVNFDLSDDARLKAESEARADAVKTAKANAQSLAGAAGITLGKIINVAEAQNNIMPPRPLMETAAGAIQKSVPQAQIEPGTTEVDIVVSLSYEVR